MASICKHTKSVNKLKEKSQAEKLRDIRNNFIIAMSLAIVLGLGWGLGLLATSSGLLEVTILFQVLFSIFVGMQGVLIFFLHGVRNNEAREVWKQCLTAVTRKSRPKYLVTSDKTASTGPTSRDKRTRGTDSIGLSTLPHSTSYQDKKLDLSKVEESEASMIQSTMMESPSATDDDMYVNVSAEVRLRDMKRNESYQTVQTHITPSSARGNRSQHESTEDMIVESKITPSATDGNILYENVSAEVQPRDMKRNESYQTVQTSIPRTGPQYETVATRQGTTSMYGQEESMYDAVQ